jgi:AbiV family abortive infection protein
MAVPIPSFERLSEGYAKTVANAMSLAAASGDGDESRIGPRLALAELAQEEVGKSFSLLAAIALPKTQVTWTQFWREFRDHDLKCARAFFYEWFEPTRISIVLKDRSTPDGITRFQRMSDEKIQGFYVDYDRSAGAFMDPGERVRPEDAANRMITVVCLAEKASALHTILTDHESEFSLREWAKIALHLCSHQTYQEEMAKLLDDFAAQSSAHRELRARVEEGMRIKASALKAMAESVRRT